MSIEKSDPKIFDPERTVLVRVVHGLLHALEPEGELAAQEDEGLAYL